MTRRFDVVSAVDELRQLVAKADALANATEDQFEGVIWSENDTDDDARRSSASPTLSAQQPRLRAPQWRPATNSPPS